MSRTTIEMAREAAGDTWGLFQEYLPEIHRLAELVRADEREQGQKWFDAVTAQHKQAIFAEREACAKVCDDLPAPDYVPPDDVTVWDVATFDCADAIRARGETSLRSNT